MTHHDVIIAGAGPVGLYLASLLEERLDVLVVDKNRRLGKKADSGLYSTHLADFIPLQRDWIEHEVSGAILHSPHGQLELRKPTTAAYVVDRERFQLWLARRLKRDILLQTAVTSLAFEGKVSVRTTRGTFTSSLLVGCDGASSTVRKNLGVRPAEILNGIIGITKQQNTDSHVDLYFDTSLIRDGFFWKIPRGRTTEYGALGKNVTFRDLEGFFPIKNYEKRAAFMNLGLFPTAFERAILVGEAAGQVKPWSLGGIIFGFTCARIARDVIFDAFEEQDFSRQLLQRYDERWKRKIGPSIRLGLALRKKFAGMDNASLDRYIRVFSKLPFLNRVDMDFPNLGLFG